VRTSAGKHRPGRVSRFSSIVGVIEARRDATPPTVVNARDVCTTQMRGTRLCDAPVFARVELVAAASGVGWVCVYGRGIAAAQGP
jgi:hypothetical protein